MKGSKIEHGIPIPVGRRSSYGLPERLRLKLELMGRGDSFVTTENQRSLLHAAKLIRARIKTETTPDGLVRVWKI